jgi:hypothetical protein
LREGMVAHVCNSSCSGDRDLKDQSPRPPWAKS